MRAFLRGLSVFAAVSSFVFPLAAQTLIEAQTLDERFVSDNDVGVPIDGAAIPHPRITQAEIESGQFTLTQLRRRGLELFTTSFNKYDGHGDGTVGPNPGTFGQRPTTNGTWLRVNGLDSQTCQECHGILSNATVPPTLGLAGVAGIANSAFPGVTEFDIDDDDSSGVAEVNGRLINPPFLFGAGGVELAGKEMTTDLQALEAFAQANPGTTVALVTKGVSFGTLSYDTGTGFDYSGVQGIDHDLVVRPFGRKGEFSSIRQFDIGALQFHMGMQASELVGAGVDGDDDGVVDEIIPGELTTMHLFGTTLERPREVSTNNSSVATGRFLFGQVGCTGCHVSSLETSTRHLPIAFPEVQTDPSANVFMTVDLKQLAGFKTSGSGIKVPLYSDLKRHDMGPGLAETTGSPLDAFFITPRLWGISDTAPYLHDGRALTLREAILAHGGEGSVAAANFGSLSAADQKKLLTFLDSLRTPVHPAKGIDQPVRRHSD